MILGQGDCFREIDDAVAALQAERGDTREVVFHWQVDVEQVPRGAIVYNCDLPLIHFGTDAMRAVAARASEIFDFSARGVAAWRRIGVDAKHCPVGWHPTMRRFERSADPDIDVVFVGAINARRAKVLGALEAVGCAVRSAPADREGRDEMLARARVSINMLYYTSGVYPALRAAHLLSNEVPYVGESCLESEWDVACPAWSTYGNLVDAVVGALESPLPSTSAKWQAAKLVLP